MRLLISDANILIYMEAGALMETLFQLPMQFGIPDLLYYEEIEPGSPGLEDLGLQVMEVSGDFVAYAQQLPGQHNHLLPSKQSVPISVFPLDRPFTTKAESVTSSHPAGRCSVPARHEGLMAPAATSISVYCLYLFADLGNLLGILDDFLPATILDLYYHGVC